MKQLILPIDDRWLIRASCLVVCVCLGWMAGSDVAAQTNADERDNGETSHEFNDSDLEFFENKIRPLLVEHCLQCHGDNEEKLRGGLRLTSRSEMLTGGDSGPAIVPGKPEESLLIASVRYEDFEMPPKGQLLPTQIADLVKWVELGAPDPRNTSSVTATQEIDIEAGKRFWAFTPRRDVPPEHSKQNSWARSTIDRYILSRLEASGILPVADADRETLIRRAYIALIGLPPTVEQIDAFVADTRPHEIAFAGVVDELLASKHFGERWGRHWLDVVRFAESSGGGRSLMFPEAWRFRDYVIDSYNADKPFDEFIREQIAGDLLPHKFQDQENERIVATGMLALGPTNYEQQDKELLRMEVIDEQVDTIGRAFLGLTLGCARCHDHKFDPIPMTDYYALAGIFGSTKSLVDGNVSSYVTRPLASESELAADKKYRAKVTALTNQLNVAKQRLAGLKPNGSISNLDAGLRGNRDSSDFRGIVIDDQNANVIGEWMQSTSVNHFVNGHYLHDRDEAKGTKKIIFTPKIETGGRFEVRMAYTSGGNRASNTPVVIEHQDGQTQIVVNQTKKPPIDNLFISLGTFRFEADNQSSVTVSTTDTDGHVIVDAIQFLPEQIAGKDDALPSNPVREPNSVVKIESASDRPPRSRTKLERAQQQFETLDQQLKTLKENGPPPVAIAMSVKEEEKPQDGHLHIRGSVRNLGPVVPRGFVSVCSEDPKPKLEAHESGRLQLAHWIAGPGNPLTARVYVNRVWRQLFGRGLVETTDNFGFVGQKPSHPELLDHLANEFVNHEWSTKKLIRQIMLSRVFQLSSANDVAARAIDDRNRLLWRANRRRLDAEVLRDSILFVSGDLDFKPGGLTIRKIEQYDLGYEFDTVRRSVYVPAFRNSMLDIFEVFDFANPNLVIGHRNTSTLPTQALFLMNNPMVIRQSRRMAARLLVDQSLEDRQRIELAYRQSIGRKPSIGEVQSALSHIQSLSSTSDDEDPKLAAWSSFCHALFASLNFRYVE